MVWKFNKLYLLFIKQSTIHLLLWNKVSMYFCEFRLHCYGGSYRLFISLSINFFRATLLFQIWSSIIFFRFLFLSCISYQVNFGLLIVMMWSNNRVATCQGKVRKNKIFSTSGNRQGILSWQLIFLPKIINILLPMYFFKS